MKDYDFEFEVALNAFENALDAEPGMPSPAEARERVVDMYRSAMDRYEAQCQGTQSRIAEIVGLRRERDEACLADGRRGKKQFRAMLFWPFYLFREMFSGWEW